MSETLPPDFFLYGEPAKQADPHFLHVEDLAVRSKPGNWRIAPHKHMDLCHLILISDGGGEIQYESDFISFSSPNLLIVPARTVHGFAWKKRSEGQVLTIALAQLQQLISQHGEFATLFIQPRTLELDRQTSHAIETAMSTISKELSWIGLGQSAALQAALLTVLVQTARRLQSTQELHSALQPHHRLVARYRQLVEDRYRMREPVSAYAKALAVSETSLREACAASGQSPAAIRDQRAILEAQRLLAFSAMRISEIGHAIGIEDPAYFSRFFTRHCGSSPAHWRRTQMRRRGEG